MAVGEIFLRWRFDRETPSRPVCALPFTLKTAFPGDNAGKSISNATASGLGVGSPQRIR